MFLALNITATYMYYLQLACFSIRSDGHISSNTMGKKGVVVRQVEFSYTPHPSPNPFFPHTA